MDVLATFNSAEFHFLRPLWLLAAIPALIFAWGFLKNSSRSSEWRNAIQPELLSALLEDNGERTNKWISLLCASGLLLMSVSLAGPTWNRLPQRMEQANDALVIILDLSLSMYAEDLSPSRLVYARHKIADILRMRKEGYTALVVFAGDAHVVTPLTDDTDTIENLLLALRPAMMPVAGSNPEYAVAQAMELIKGSSLLQGSILILSDGISNINDISQYANPDIPISILGIGTKVGAPIPLDFMNRPGDFLPNSQGQTVIAKLDVNTLEAAAKDSYGRFIQTSIGDSDILYLLDNSHSEENTQEVDRQFDVWADKGYLLIILLIPLLAFSFRRGILLVLCLGILPAPPANALSLEEAWDGLWQRKDQQAYEALGAGQAERAAQLFQDPDWRAAAEYRSGAFDSAAGAYQQLQKNYNLGNALAKLGDYQGAIEAYENVLKDQPEHENALFNKQLVEQAKQQQEQEDSDKDQEGEEEQQSEQENQNSDSSQQDSSSDSGDQKEESDEQQDSEEDKQQEAKNKKQEDEQKAKDEQEEQASIDEQNQDEKQKAMEQWLRRVPDDPGGLLKRKFQHETNQRLRRGDYQRKQSDQVW